MQAVGHKESYEMTSGHLLEVLQSLLACI